MAFNTLRSWLNSDSALKSFVIGNAKHRWSQLCPTRASTQLSYDQSVFTCKELNKRLNCAADFGLAPTTTIWRSRGASHPVAAATNSKGSSPVTSVRMGTRGDSAKIALACKQAVARDKHWDLVKQACDSDDHKEFSKNQAWRSELMNAHSVLLRCCNSKKHKLAQATEIVRSKHPGRAQIDVNPVQVAVALQAAVKEGNITSEQAQTMVHIAADGITVEEFREILGESLDLSEGNTEDPIDHEILLDFYFAQAARGRCFLFPECDATVLDSQGSVVLSPSFLVRVLGKNPRPICNLSSAGNGVNQMMEDMEANDDGYTTIPGVAEMIVDSYINMVLNPQDYNIESVHDIDLAMLVADAADAFTRIGVSSAAVGMQCLRIGNITVVPMCCLFGWRRSAEVFSHVTASIAAAYKSNLDSVKFLQPDILRELENSGHNDLSENLKRLMADHVPEHSHLIKQHVDDFGICELAKGWRCVGAASDLIWSIKAHLGAASISVKKFLASSFWSDFQKVIGGWFNVESFTVTMPYPKICEVIDILESDNFNSDAKEFEIDQCATLRGKLRWALLATKLGDSPALINIEKKRATGKSNKRKVKPSRFHNESQELATAKFHNDMCVYRHMMYACRDNPSVASCSMVSMLPLEKRLLIPGQSKWLVWLSGDFSMLAQSYGVELWHPEKGNIKLYSVIKHPKATVTALRLALAGNSIKGGAVVSSVCERANKLMCEFQHRELLAARPTACLEDNQGSVAVMNKGYSANLILQAMQLVSNLRQAVDEAPMEAFWTSTHNMSWFDQSSRLEYKFCERMNNDLIAMGEAPWVEIPPCKDAHAINEWVPLALESEMPMLQTLLESLDGVAAKSDMPAVSLSADELLSPLENSWQKRIQAAVKPIPHYMGSFGPQAYCTDHLNSSTSEAIGNRSHSWHDLRKLNDQHAASTCYTMFDTFHGGCGGSVAAIQAGIFVQAGSDSEAEEVQQFESLTGRISLGDVRLVQPERLPYFHIWFSCSSCKNFANLGDKKGNKGTKGGNMFEAQFTLAAAAKAKVVVLENVDGVATIEGGVALANLIANAEKLGYTKLYHRRITFAQYGDPENRSRRVIVAFHKTVNLTEPWSWPVSNISSWSLDHDKRKCAGEILKSSTHIPESFWDDRPWTIVGRTWKPADTLRIFTVGYKNMRDRVGPPHEPSRVWLPTGLFPTCLASGNSGLVLTMWLRAMCPLYSAMTSWFKVTFKKNSKSKRTGKNRRIPARNKQVGRARTRKATPEECLISKGFPEDTPFSSEESGYRFAGNAVPCNWFTGLFKQITCCLQNAGVSTKLKMRANQYITWTNEPIHSHDLILQKGRYGAPKAKKGHNIVLHVSRDSAAAMPMVKEELALISAQGVFYTDGRYAMDSKAQLDLGWRHWRSFCLRMNRPLFLRSSNPTECAAAAAQAKLFLHYETALHDVKARSVAQKIWAVGVKHKDQFQGDPFAGNQMVKDALADAMAKDEPQKPKVPITNETLVQLRRKLNLAQRPAFVFWTAVRFAIAFLCRISEYAVKDKHTLTWQHIIFYTHKDSPQGRVPLKIKNVADVTAAAEIQVIFYSDKTSRPGNGRARSFFAISDVKDSKCIVRDMARLWLVSEQVLDYDVFSWDANSKGVDRAMVNDLLKEAAIEAGIPGADVASHSLRRTGLCRLMSAKPVPMPWPLAKKFGRWESDCALRYFWASTELAADYASSIWDSACFVNVRGKGDVQAMRG